MTVGLKLFITFVSFILVLAFDSAVIPLDHDNQMRLAKIWLATVIVMWIWL